MIALNNITIKQEIKTKEKFEQEDKTHHYFFSGKAEVWTDNQFFCTKRTTFFEFGSQEYAYAAQ